MTGKTCTREQKISVNVPPRLEASLYGETTRSARLLFPPEEGFIVKPQCRLGNFAHWNAGEEKSRRSSTGTNEGPAAKGVQYPDAVVAWTTYDPSNPPAEGDYATQIPVLVQEVKRARVLHKHTAVDRARAQISKYLKRINDTRTGAEGYYQPPPGQTLPMAQGVLIFGTRCIRFAATRVAGRVEVAQMDSFDGPELHYHLNDGQDVLLQWFYGIGRWFRNHLPQGVTPGKDFHLKWFTHYADYILKHPVVYENSLYYLIYDALSENSRSKFATSVVRPQVALCEPAPVDEVTEETPRNSFDVAVQGDVIMIPDFMTVIAVTTANMKRHNVAMLIVEAKTQDDGETRNEAFAQTTGYLKLFLSMGPGGNGPRVPAIVVLGGRYWRVGWRNKKPEINWNLPGKTLVDLWTDQNIWFIVP